MSFCCSCIMFTCDCFQSYQSELSSRSIIIVSVIFCIINLFSCVRICMILLINGESPKRHLSMSITSRNIDRFSKLCDC